MRAALNEALKRKHITENPAVVARAPRPDDEEVEPCSVEEVQRILRAAESGRNSARWAVALALGLRQGEALGLMRTDVDIDAGTLLVMRSRLRPRWKHGAPSRAAGSSATTARTGSRCARRRPPRRRERAGAVSAFRIP
jgi:integrase